MEENYKLPKLNLLVIGKTGVGKSTLLNSLFGKILHLRVLENLLRRISTNLRRKAGPSPFMIRPEWNWAESIRQKIC